MLYSKGDAVGTCSSLDHRGRTVASFTITPEPHRRARRSRSARPRRHASTRSGALHHAGYPTRVRFSPIIPFVGWRDDYDELVARIARVASPELITFWTLTMIELDELPRIVPLAMLEPGVLEQARRASRLLAGDKGAPFPEKVRARIYSELTEIVRGRLPQTRVSLCLESPAGMGRAARHAPVAGARRLRLQLRPSGDAASGAAGSERLPRRRPALRPQGAAGVAVPVCPRSRI